MACSNCFNGCADIVSDQCVKYTGIDIPGLGIVAGDPLLVVENQIISKILELISGEGVVPDIPYGELCNVISDNLPSSGDITLNDIITTLFTAVCNIDFRVFTAEETLTTLNADYNVDCLDGVFPDYGTHDILQATILKLCEVEANLTTLAAELVANYVLVGDINDYIAAYIESQPVSTLYNTKMIPYVAVPYFGPVVGFFDITGAGLDLWEKIYLCNGQNLTPDLRGRTLVGNTTMGNTAFNPAVDPTIAGNPTYSQGDLVGANLAFLTSPSQIPLHTHDTVVTINDPSHSHILNTLARYNSSGNGGGSLDTVNDTNSNFATTSNPTGLKGTGAGQNVFVEVLPTGGGSSEGHNNIQPVVSTNFIIYIP